MTKPPTKAVILAAGWGSRLLPATKSLAKPMLPIVDRPAIDYIVQDLVDAGIKDIIIVGKQHFEQIEEYFDRHLELEELLRSGGKQEYLAAITKFKDVNFTFIRQGTLAGTGDAVMSAFHLLPDNEPIIVYFSDDLFSPHSCIKSLLEVYQDYPGTVVASQKVPKDRVHLYGVAKIQTQINDRLFQVKGIMEKPKNDDAPSDLVVVSPIIVAPEVIRLLAKKQRNDTRDSILLPPIIGEAAEQGHPTYFYHAEEEWLDTGNKLGFIKAQITMALNDPSIKKEVEEYIKSKIQNSPKGHLRG